jgi:hypothetical protein
MLPDYTVVMGSVLLVCDLINRIAKANPCAVTTITPFAIECHWPNFLPYADLGFSLRLLYQQLLHACSCVYKVLSIRLMITCMFQCGMPFYIKADNHSLVNVHTRTGPVVLILRREKKSCFSLHTNTKILNWEPSVNLDIISSIDNIERFVM